MGGMDVANINANGAVTADVAANLVAAIDTVDSKAAGRGRVVAGDRRERIALIELRDHAGNVGQFLNDLVTNRG